MGISAKPNRPLFELDLLRVMVAVADSGNFTAAAARLHSTQSTISQKVRRLEEMAGHRLLERGNREIDPTDAALLGYARRMLALNDGLLEALAGPDLALSIRLGVPDDFVTPRMTATLAAFSRRSPQVKLEVTSGLSREPANLHGGWPWFTGPCQRHGSRSAPFVNRRGWHQSQPPPLAPQQPAGEQRQANVGQG